MKTLSRQEIIAHTNNIQGMSRNELESFFEKVSTSNIDGKSKFYIYEAIDLRIEQLNKQSDSIVFNGDISDMNGNV